MILVLTGVSEGLALLGVRLIAANACLAIAYSFLAVLRTVHEHSSMIHRAFAASVCRVCHSRIG